MKRMLITLLCAVLLVSCATPAIDYSKSPNVIASNAEYWAARGVEYPPIPSVPTPRTAPRSTPGVSGWDVLRTIAAIPILGSVAILSTAYGPYNSHRVHCYSYTYKDQYHVKC